MRDLTRCFYRLRLQSSDHHLDFRNVGQDRCLKSSEEGVLALLASRGNVYVEKTNKKSRELAKYCKTRELA